MPTENRYFAVDRLEAGVAVLISDRGKVFEVASALLPEGARDGTVLRLEWDGVGEVPWATAEIDRAEAERRVDDVRRILDALRKRDPGGDVVM